MYSFPPPICLWPLGTTDTVPRRSSTTSPKPSCHRPGRAKRHAALESDRAREPSAQARGPAAGRTEKRHGRAYHVQTRPGRALVPFSLGLTTAPAGPWSGRTAHPCSLLPASLRPPQPPPATPTPRPRARGPRMSSSPLFVCPHRDGASRSAGRC